MIVWKVQYGTVHNVDVISNIGIMLLRSSRKKIIESPVSRKKGRRFLKMYGIGLMGYAVLVVFFFTSKK